MEKKNSEEKAAQKAPEEDAILKDLKMVKETSINLQKIKSEQAEVSNTDKIVEQLIMPEDHKKGDVSI